jgi:hypothetical protein
VRVLIGARRGLGVALFGLILGCGATTQDGTRRGGAGSPAAGQGASASGGSQTSASGGAASDAGAGGNSQPAGGSNGVAGSGVTPGGSPATAGGGGGVANGGVASGGVGGTGGVAGAGEDPNKIVLFDGSEQSFNSWYPRNGGMKAPNPWTNNGDGTMTVKGDDILTKMPFTNVFVHLEYWSPKFDYSPGTDFTQRGASGVFLNGSYELVIVDTFGLSLEPGHENAYCGAIHTISDPLVSACKPGGEWNAYDIEFRAEVCTAGVKTTNAEFVEVRLNGILVQQNVAVAHVTQAGLNETCEARGVLLQNVSTVVPVSFRNIWAIPRD